MLTLIAAGLDSGHQTIPAIAQWIHLHTDRLRAALPNLTTLPSESIPLRIIRQIDVGLLEAAVAQLTQPHTAANGAAGQMGFPPVFPSSKPRRSMAQPYAASHPLPSS